MEYIKIFKFFLLVLTTNFFVGCSYENETNLNLESDRIDNIVKMEESVENINIKENGFDSLNYNNERGLDIRNNEIYFNNKKIGWILENRMFLTFEDNIYSFEYTNGFDKLEFNPRERFDGVVHYDGVTINFPADYDIEVVYQCNGALLEWRNYEYCETNGENYLEQYEFGGYYRQFSTGGGFPLSWKKIFIKKINDKNIIFEIDLDGASIDSSGGVPPLELVEVYKSLLKYGFVEDLNLNTDLKLTDFDSNYNQANIDYDKIEVELELISEEMNNIVKSKKYLDKIRKEAVALEKEEKVKAIIESFRFEK